MNKIIVINKPSGYTSRDVVNIISKKYNTKKVGHTGTLDPLATGVLIICIGKYTKLVDLITSYDKEYIATVILGISTDTYDIEGNIISSTNTNNITKEDINKALKKFTKTYMQEVPIYSAVKINGRKLYDYARNNEKIALPKKEVSINSLELLDIKYLDNKCIFSMKTNVSKGTYIRSLINDIGNYLGCGATMKDLCRTKQGTFDINNSNNLNDEIYNEININDVLKFPFIEIIDEEFKKQILNGNIIDNTFNLNMIGFTIDNNLIAIYKTYEKDSSKLKPYKML